MQIDLRVGVQGIGRLAGQRWVVGFPGAADAAAHPADTEARLLVVEDEPTILELLSGSLRFAGFSVLTAVSGAEAVRVAAASRPDLILLDVMLHDGDGFDVIRSIRAGSPRVP